MEFDLCNLSFSHYSLLRFPIQMQKLLIHSVTYVYVMCSLRHRKTRTDNNNEMNMRCYSNASRLSHTLFARATVICIPLSHIGLTGRTTVMFVLKYWHSRSVFASFSITESSLHEGGCREQQVDANDGNTPTKAIQPFFVEFSAVCVPIFSFFRFSFVLWNFLASSDSHFVLWNFFSRPGCEAVRAN